MRSIRPPRRSLRAAFVALVGVAALLAAPVAPVTVGAAASVTPAAAAPVVLPASTAHGEGFQIRSVSDPSYCVEVDAGATDLRSVTMAQCNVGSQQRWTFSWLASGLNELIEIQGMCVDVSSRKPGDGLAVPVTFCKGTKAEHLSFLPGGQIEFAKGCLSIPRAGAGAAVFLEACDSTHTLQFWKLSQ